MKIPEHQIISGEFVQPMRWETQFLSLRRNSAFTKNQVKMISQSRQSTELSETMWRSGDTCKSGENQKPIKSALSYGQRLSKHMSYQSVRRTFVTNENWRRKIRRWQKQVNKWWMLNFSCEYLYEKDDIVQKTKKTITYLIIKNWIKIWLFIKFHIIKN